MRLLLHLLLAASLLQAQVAAGALLLCQEASGELRVESAMDACCRLPGSGSGTWLQGLQGPEAPAFLAAAGDCGFCLDARAGEGIVQLRPRAGLSSELLWALGPVTAAVALAAIPGLAPRDSAYRSTVASRSSASLPALVDCVVLRC